MLHDFIVANRDLIIDRARRRVRGRMPPNSIEAKLEHGIPLFLTQLADALAPDASVGSLRLVGSDFHRCNEDEVTELGRRLQAGDSTAARGKWLVRRTRMTRKAKPDRHGGGARAITVDSLKVPELLRENGELRAELGELKALLAELATEFNRVS